MSDVHENGVTVFDTNRMCLTVKRQHCSFLKIIIQNVLKEWQIYIVLQNREKMSANNGVEAGEGFEEGDVVEIIGSLFCDICQRYYDKKYYKTHVETHREDVKVKCTVCNNEYRNQHSLDTHMQKKHKNGQNLETKSKENYFVHFIL